MSSSSSPAPSPAKTCHHIKTSGVQCGSPALRGRRYCHYHQRARPIMVNFASQDNPILFALPIFEDAHAIQFTLRNVAHHLLEGFISEKKAGLMLYALQIASANLRNLKAEEPQPDQVIVDPPRLSEIDRPAPLPNPVRMNSHTPRFTHFPETPTMEDEYYDDVLRTQREQREEQKAFKAAAAASKNSPQSQIASGPPTPPSVPVDDKNKNDEGCPNI